MATNYMYGIGMTMEHTRTGYRRWRTRGVMTALSVVIVGAVAAILATVPAAADTQRRDGRWTGAWMASMVAPAPAVFGQPNWSLEGFGNQSLRQVVRVSRGGMAFRIRLSNVYGSGPLLLAGASLGVAGDGASVRPGTLRTLTFGRAASTVVPAGRELASDAVQMRVSPLERLTVTLLLAQPTGPATFHPLAFASSYRAAGDHRLDQGAGAFGEVTTSWYYLDG